MQRAIHSRFFRHIYRCPKRSDIFSSIKVCVNTIYFTICVGAFKHLICSFSNMLTIMARLTRIPWVNSYYFNTIQQSLVFNILSKHREIPFTKFSPKLFVSPFTCKSDSSEVFNSDSLTLLFSRLNNLFCNSVINNVGVSSFFATKPFQEFFSSLCAFALNRTTNFLPMFTVFVKSISRKLNIIGSMSDCGQTKIIYNNIGLIGILFVSLYIFISI